MIVCHCVGVTDCTIKQLISDGASSVAEITRRCGAGRCCAPCQETIASMLYSAPQPPHNRPAVDATTAAG
jgi:bacterioferritin-associated ferredoxin